MSAVKAAIFLLALGLLAPSPLCEARSAFVSGLRAYNLSYKGYPVNAFVKVTLGGRDCGKTVVVEGNSNPIWANSMIGCANPRIGSMFTLYVYHLHELNITQEKLLGMCPHIIDKNKDVVKCRSASLSIDFEYWF